MKKYLIIFSSVLALFFTTGCNDFLDRPPLDKIIDDEKFWRNESDFRMFSIEFYEWFFTGYNSGYVTTYTPLRGYTFSDDLSSGSGNQENFMSTIPGSVVSAPSQSGLLSASWLAQYNGERWNYGWVRKANIMIERLETYKDRLSEPAYKHWMAVARFFRAYAYYNLVISFGNVPYFDKPVDLNNQAAMYKDRDDRGFVMDKVYDDLKYAMENAYVKDNGSTQYVNRDLIAGLTSRFMLFEGTWQKYHNLNAERAKKYLQLCVDASKIVMDTKKYSCTRDFRSIFGSDDLAAHPEVIFYRVYFAAKTTHSVASYSNGIESQPGVNLQLIKSFLCTDGQPYKSSTVANATDFNLVQLAKTRDPRFEATFYNFPHKKSLTMIYADKFISREGASYWNNSGNLPSKYGSLSNENDAPIIRYGEVLLDWIEAKAELAESYGGTAVTQADIDLSINSIRNRPLDAKAIANGVSKTAPMQLASLPNDPDRDPDIPALIWEIRRERRMEFVYEHTRLLDIKRWKKITYMDNNKYPDTMFGSWVNFPQDVPEYLIKSYEGKLKVRKADGTEVTYNGTNGADMVGFYKIQDVKPRDAFNEARTYLAPVGTDDMDNYAKRGFKLTQTAAWQ